MCLYPCLFRSRPPSLEEVRARMEKQERRSGRSRQRRRRRNAMVPINPNDSGRRKPKSDDPEPGKFFVGGLSWQTSSEQLWKYFSQFGILTDVFIIKNPQTQCSRGFGFIKFAEPDSVDRVLKYPLHILHDRKIEPKYPIASKNRVKHDIKTIFVGGVSHNATCDEVKAYFNQFGEIEKFTMPLNQEWCHRGFGFITFKNKNVADRVCELHYHTIQDKSAECVKLRPKNRNIECEKLRPKEVRQPSALDAQDMRLAPRPLLPAQLPTAWPSS